jgi:hypothetical protein
VTLSTRSLYYSAPAGNRETAHFCQEAGAFLQPGALLDPRLPVAAQSVTGARLLSVMPATQRYPIPFAPLTDLLRDLQNAGSKVPIFFEGKRAGDVTRLQRTIENVGLTCPILIGSVDADCLIEAISVARANEQVSLVTNGFRGIGEIALAVSALGAERVVFGSEAPIRSLGAALALVRRAGLSESERESVLGGNAKRILAAGGAAK